MNKILLILIGVVVCASGCQSNRHADTPTALIADSERADQTAQKLSLSDETISTFLNQHGLKLVDYNRQAHVLKIDVAQLDVNRYDDMESIGLLMEVIQKELKEEKLTVVGINRLKSHLNPISFEVELKNDRILFKKIEHIRFNGALEAFVGAREIYERQKPFFDANRLKINRDGTCRLWKSEESGVYVGFGMKNAPENFVTTVDGNKVYFTSLRGKLLNVTTLEELDESAISEKNEAADIINTENDCALLYHSKINIVEWVDLLSGQRIILNLSLLGDDVDVNSFKSVDKNKKRYMILKVNKPKTSEYVVHVPLDSNGLAISDELQVSHTENLEAAETVEGFVIQEE